MGLLQWFTVLFTGFVCLLALIYWLGWSKPTPVTDYRKEIFVSLVGIAGTLIGAFLQEFRVQDKARQAAEARQVAATLSAGLTQVQGLTARLNLEAGTARDSLRRSQAVLDSIKTRLLMTAQAAIGSERL